MMNYSKHTSAWTFSTVKQALVCHSSHFSPLPYTPELPLGPSKRSQGATRSTCSTCHRLAQQSGDIHARVPRSDGHQKSSAQPS